MSVFFIVILFFVSFFVYPNNFNNVIAQGVCISGHDGACSVPDGNGGLMPCPQDTCCSAGVGDDGGTLPCGGGGPGGPSCPAQTNQSITATVTPDSPTSATLTWINGTYDPASGLYGNGFPQSDWWNVTISTEISNMFCGASNGPGTGCPVSSRPNSCIDIYFGKQ